MKYLLILFALFYLLFPFDIIPDFAGLIGRLDDLAVIAFIVYRYRAMLKSFQRQTADETQTRRETPPQNGARRLTPHEVLDLPRDASQEQIDEQYKKLMTQYHPDKVAHLGEDLKRLAHEKTIEIQNAYRALKRN